MRKSGVLVAGVLLLIGPALLAGALSRAELDRVIDFSVTLKSLAVAVQDGSPLPQGKTVLLSGTVSDVNVVNKDPADFRVRLELITGEWIGLDDVKAYTCYVDFAGADYCASHSRPSSPGGQSRPGDAELQGARGGPRGRNHFHGARRQTGARRRGIHPAHRIGERPRRVHLLARRAHALVEQQVAREDVASAGGKNRPLHHASKLADVPGPGMGEKFLP